MLRSSSSFSSEEDQDNHRSSPSIIQPQSPPPISFNYHHFHLINTSSPPLLASSSSSITPSQVIHPRQLLVTCAELVSRSEFSSANRLLNLLSTDFASQSGDSTERLVYYICKALNGRVNRYLSTTFITNPNTPPHYVLQPGPSIFLSPQYPNPNPNLATNPSNVTTPRVTQEGLVTRVRCSSYLSLNQVTPFIRFTHLTANQAILEAIEGCKAIHILDMEIMHGVQWPPLLQAVVERAATLGRPTPTIRITGAGWDQALLERTGDRLCTFARSLGLEFQFNDLVLHNSEVVDHADLVENALLVVHQNNELEALAVNCGDYLHRLLREYDTRSLRRFLHKVKTLNPRVLTIGEREADHNHPLFLRRFNEALDHYGSLFDSLEATLPPQSQERVAVEEGWFGGEIKDVVGEEGESRRERHQRYESWEVLLRSSGFKSVALSPFSLSQAKLLLRLHYPSEGYQLQVVNTNCLMLGWKNRPLFSVSSWQ
ncbi:scarecrow-like protein 18 [Silene latifolia]|uniref:scarecrow-like protein 18 n=1 Tax=Silene latifolia TaxID=37657 RepID=UPI003D77E3C8